MDRGEHLTWGMHEKTSRKKQPECYPYCDCGRCGRKHESTLRYFTYDHDKLGTELSGSNDDVDEEEDSPVKLLAEVIGQQDAMVVTTLNIASNEDGNLSVTCTGMGGNELAALEVHSRCIVAELRSKLKKTLPMSRHQLEDSGSCINV